MTLYLVDISAYEKTLEKLKRFWFWPGMTKDTKEYIQTCAACQTAKHSTQPMDGLLQPIKAKYPWQIVSMDFVGKFRSRKAIRQYHVPRHRR